VLGGLWLRPRQTFFGALNERLILGLVHRAIVATRNIDDFLLIDRHFSLPGLFDPWTGIWHVPYAKSVFD
jgi:toxin FitB